MQEYLIKIGRNKKKSFNIVTDSSYQQTRDFRSINYCRFWITWTGTIRSLRLIPCALRPRMCPDWRTVVVNQRWKTARPCAIYAKKPIFGTNWIWWPTRKRCTRWNRRTFPQKWVAYFILYHSDANYYTIICRLVCIARIVTKIANREPNWRITWRPIHNTVRTLENTNVTFATKSISPQLAWPNINSLTVRYVHNNNVVLRVRSVTAHLIRGTIKSDHWYEIQTYGIFDN